MDNFIRLIYSSRMKSVYNNPTQMNDIIRQTQRFNPSRQIGGQMYWNENDASIIQIIEGRSIVINTLYEKIKRDPRHGDICLLSCLDIGASDIHFAKWDAKLIYDFNEIPSIADYQMKSIIGVGGMATVTLCQHVRNKRYYAIKIISKKRLSERKIDKMITERNVLSIVRHPFLNTLKCSMQDACNVYLVTPFASRGDLYNFVYSTPLAEETVLFYLGEIVCGLAHLHNKGIIHNDIKLENVLVNHDGHIMLSDFGISTICNASTYHDTKHLGTPVYFAPEVITHNARTTKSDIWAVGVVLYEMITQSIPWQHLPRPEMFKVIRTSKLGVKDTCVHTNELLALMCCYEADDRTSCNSLMDHMLRMDIVDDWSDVVAKKNVAPVIPDIMRTERNTIPDFDMNRDASSHDFSPLLYEESTFEDGGFGLD